MPIHLHHIDREMQDIIPNPPGVTRAGTVHGMEASYELFITTNILDIIMRETNREANQIYAE